MPLPDIVKVEFTIESGYRRVDKLKVLASEIDALYSQLKSETGQTLDFECRKQPWQTGLHVVVEGPKETVKDFLRRIHPSVEKLRLKGVPEHWYDLG
jgi:hypothetical protein